MEKHIEKIARAYRNAIYGDNCDDRSWEACRDNWIRDTKVFLGLLAKVGLEIVEAKPPLPPKKPRFVDEPT